MTLKMEFVQTRGIWRDKINFGQMRFGFVSLTIRQVCGIVILCILSNQVHVLISYRGRTVSISEVSQTAKANAQHF
jgi:REP element-mobilizing transposase RayT